MSIRTHLLAALCLAGFLATSCAVTQEEDSNYALDRVMKAWINTNYPGLQPYGNTGAYFLELEKGNGPTVGDSAYVWAHYVKRTLNQTITATNVRELAEQLGSYTNSGYYGSAVWRVDQGYLPEALETMIKTMRGGDRARIALPYSASGHNYSMYKAFSSSSESDNLIIDLTIDTVVADIYDYQERIMRSWFNEHYAVSDTLREGLYFKKLEKKESDTDTIAEGNSVSVRYIGRRLDGSVFDTNIEDTAKFYRIWDGNNSYSGLSISYYKEEDSKISSENSVVEGFARAVQQMNYGETAVTLFSSKLGYGESGSSPSIPEYAPLVFWLYVEPKD